MVRIMLAQGRTGQVYSQCSLRVAWNIKLANSEFARTSGASKRKCPLGEGRRWVEPSQVNSAGGRGRGRRRDKP
jgi:hypothetical protein